MKRRVVLVGMSSLPITAGCLGDYPTSLGSKPETTNMDSTKSYRRTVSVEQVDSVPEGYGVDLTLEVTQAKITDTQTAHLKATVTNTGQKKREFDPAYYKGPSSRDGDPGILLYSLRAPDSPPADYAPDCIGKSGKSQEKLRWTQEHPGMETLKPRKTSSEELIVVDDPTVRGCIPTGDYRFENLYNISEFIGDKSGSQDSKEWQFRWGFTIRIDDEEK